MLLMGYYLNVAGGLGRVCTIVIFTANISSMNPPLQILAGLIPNPRNLIPRMRHHRHNIIGGDLTVGNQNIRLNPQPNN